jgi:hypothetical protein
MTEALFVCISDFQISRLIDNSTERVALVAPGIGIQTAEALMAARKRLGDQRVFVVVDCDEEVVRLGYGSLEALEKITQSGQRVGQSSGLRIGVLVCDQVAWSFAPTALYVESEVHSNETPNAIVLQADDVERILSRVIPKELREDVLKPDIAPPALRVLKDSLSGQLPFMEVLDGALSRKCDRAVSTWFKAQISASENAEADEPCNLQTFLEHLIKISDTETVLSIRPYIEQSWFRLRSKEGSRVESPNFDTVFAALESQKIEPESLALEISTAEVEIGTSPVSTILLSKTKRALDLAPPIPFDVARQVRVFEPYIQYVEISLKGCHIERRTVELPSSIQGLDPDADLSSRLHTKFDLIERSSNVSSSQMDSQIIQLRDLTKSLGKPWGRVLLRSTRNRFDKRVVEIRSKLEEHKKAVEAKLEEVLADSRKRLMEHFFGLVKAKPPDELLSQITNDPPTDDQINSWLERELDKTFPKPSDLMSDMSLDVQFRDVTYETLNQPGFGEKLREAFPLVNWDKPFEEFDAARERESPESKRGLKGKDK